MNFRLLVESKKYKTIGYVTYKFLLMKSSIFLNFASANKQEGIRLLLNEMNEIKLPGMYKSFIKYAQKEIKQVQ